VPVQGFGQPKRLIGHQAELYVFSDFGNIIGLN